MRAPARSAEASSGEQRSLPPSRAARRSRLVSRVHAAVDVAWILQAQGQTERAAALLTRCLEVIGDRGGVFAELHLTQARALALLGREPEALASLRRDIDRGFYWWLAAADPTLASLGPELPALLAEARDAAAARLAGSAVIAN